MRGAVQLRIDGREAPADCVFAARRSVAITSSLRTSGLTNAGCSPSSDGVVELQLVGEAPGLRDALALGRLSASSRASRCPSAVCRSSASALVVFHAL